MRKRKKGVFCKKGDKYAMDLAKEAEKQFGIVPALNHKLSQTQKVRGRAAI